jgi:hypothetical protein
MAGAEVYAICAGQYHGDLEAIEKVLCYVKDVDEYKGASNRTPLLAACSAQYLNAELIQRLIDAGANVNAKDVSLELSLLSAMANYLRGLCQTCRSMVRLHYITFAIEGEIIDAIKYPVRQINHVPDSDSLSTL